MPSEIAGRSNSPFTWASLPIDVAIEIVKCLGPKTLRRVATVSSAWVSITRSIVFEEVTVKSEDPEFFALVESPHCTFRPHVRKLRFHKRNKVIETLADEIARILDVLPNVTRFAFKNYSEVFSLYTGPRILFEQIRGLELEIYSARNVIPEARFLSQLLSWFPRIYQLECSSFGGALLWSLSIDPDSVDPSRSTRPAVSARFKPTELFLHRRDSYPLDDQPEMIHTLASLRHIRKVTVQYIFYGPYTLRRTHVIMKNIGGSLEHLTLILPLLGPGKGDINHIIERNSNLHTLELQAAAENLTTFFSVLEKITIRRLRTLILYINFNFATCDRAYKTLITVLEMLMARPDVFGQLERIVYDFRLFLEEPYDRSEIEQIWDRFKGEDFFARVDFEVKLRLIVRPAWGWEIPDELPPRWAPAKERDPHADAGSTQS